VGFAGDGGLATAAQFNTPLGVAFDKSGNVYINDRLNYRIRKVDALTGIISTVAGNGVAGFSGDGGPATMASISGAPGIACDTFGNLFISDHSNNRIRKVNTAGIISTYAGTGTSGFSGDGGLADTARISLPLGITCDLAGNLYFIDGGCIGVRKINKSTGIITTIAGSGMTGYSGDGGPATSAKFYNPVAVTVDINNNLYIADKGNQRVRKVDNAGTITTVAGTGITGYSGDGGIATAANLYNPEGVACNSSGNLYIADFANHRIRKVTFNEDIEMSVNISSGPTYPMGTTVTVTATVSNAGSSYLIRWMNRGMEFATTTVPTVTYTKGPGTDTITARVVSTATYGCYDSTTSAPHYVHEGMVGVAYTPAMATNLRLYPNPAHTQLTISTTEPITSLCITNVLGQVVAAPPFLPQGEVTLPVEHLPKGVYVVRVNGVYIQRFVKE
jgi:hypothetical protein